MKISLRYHPIVRVILLILINIVSFGLLQYGMLLRGQGGGILGSVLVPCAYGLFIITMILFMLEALGKEKEKVKINEYVKLNESYKEQLESVRARQHDLKNQLAVIEGLLGGKKAGADSATAGLVEQLGNQLNEISMVLKFDNSPIGMLFADKYRLAVEKGLSLKLKPYMKSMPESGMFSQYDLVAILGNLLDNAIESADRGSEITAELGEKDGFLYFSIANSGELESRDIDAVFRAGYSTKGENRGYGLYNVKSLVTKNGGNIELVVENGKIEFRVYIPLSA
jgi:two-component system, LytTR family, sensor histidine kinase AgrC